MRCDFKEYGYLAVMGLCLVCSAVLLVSVVTDRPLVEAAGEHLPVLRVEKTAEEEASVHNGAEPATESALSDTSSGYLLTEEFVEERLAEFLPETFPAEDVEVSFEGGVVSLSFDMSRAGLKDYLKGQGAELGTGRSLLLQMMPRQLELEGCFALSADGEGLRLAPVRFSAGEKDFPLTGLPEGTFSALDTGLNALLENAGVSFSSAEFTEGGILLK